MDQAGRVIRVESQSDRLKYVSMLAHHVANEVRADAPFDHHACNALWNSTPLAFHRGGFPPA
jgi:hypothetical protein